MDLGARKLMLDNELSREDKMMMLFAVEDSLLHQRKILKDMANDDARGKEEIYQRIMGGVISDIFNKAALIDRMLPCKEEGEKYFNVVFPADVAAEIQEMVRKYHNTALALSSDADHVTQVWSDGEITDQKAGSLLWQRTLRSIEGGFPGINPDNTNILWPEATSMGGYIFCTREHAQEIRQAMMMAIIKQIV